MNAPHLGQMPPFPCDPHQCCGSEPHAGPTLAAMCERGLRLSRSATRPEGGGAALQGPGSGSPAWANSLFPLFPLF